jgi:hypothetical protein
MDLDDVALAAAADAWTASQTKYDTLKVVAGGRVVVEHVYQGDASLVADAPDNRLSLRKLAALVGTSAGRLSVAARTTLLYDRLPEELRDGLSASHYEVLLRAPEIERERWAREAVVAQLGYRTLAKLIADESREEPASPRPTAPPPPPVRPPRDPSAMAATQRTLPPLRTQAKAVAGHPKAAAAFVVGIDKMIEALKELRDLALVPNPASNA